MYTEDHEVAREEERIAVAITVVVAVVAVIVAVATVVVICLALRGSGSGTLQPLPQPEQCGGVIGVSDAGQCAVTRTRNIPSLGGTCDWASRSRSVIACRSSTVIQQLHRAAAE